MVYSVMVGGYDEVLQPIVMDERFDYVLFTDKKTSDRLGVWEVRTFDYHDDDKTRESRYPKMHPEELLSEYEASLYIDANLSIANKDINDKVVSFCEQGVDWAGILLPHPPHSDCIYEHAFFLMANRFDKEKTIIESCHKLRDERYPRHNGLHENNVIYRKNNEVCKKIDEMWWDFYCRYSRRDQLSLEYVLWNYPEVELGMILPKGERAFDSDSFYFNEHNGSADTSRYVKVRFFEFVRDKIRATIPEKRKQFEDFHYWLYRQPIFISRVLLFFWGVVYTPKCLVGYLKRKRERLLKNSKSKNFLT